MRALIVAIVVLAFVAEPVVAKRDGLHPNMVPPGQAKKAPEPLPEPGPEPNAAPPPAAVSFEAPDPASPETPASPPGDVPSAAVPVHEEPPPVVAAPQDDSPQTPADPAPEAGALPAGDEPASEPSASTGDTTPAVRPRPAIRITDSNGVLPSGGVAVSALLGASAAAVGTRAYRASRAPGVPSAGPKPSGKRGDLQSLLRRAERNPFDGEARFCLGLELLERGREAEAMRYLAQAFRYHPQAILELLREPRLAHVRNHAGVREILRRFQRESSRRLWTGYT